MLRAISASKLSALLSLFAALVIVGASFFKWSQISVDGFHIFYRWVKPMLVVVAALLVASLVALLLSD